LDCSNERQTQGKSISLIPGYGETQFMVLDRKKVLRDLGDGLMLRQATLDDTSALVDFNARLHYDGDDGKLDERIGAWTRDLMEKPHPTFQVGDFTIVEDTTSGSIVSTMNLISQTWSYAGIPIKVGRPELVGTALEYRNRGLVRAQFEVIHQWSRARGEILQGITGIPYYYRIFGYEMALSLGGGRAGFKMNNRIWSVLLKKRTSNFFRVFITRAPLVTWSADSGMSNFGGTN
jgi:hypothetical protein